MKSIIGLACALLCALPAFAKDLVPYERFTLPNGLRVIVHEDRKAPIVAVQVVYHVGAKDEVTGKTGLAHLFEHLMFKGSEHFKGDFFQTLDNAGATGVNAVTTLDSTTFFETVPTPSLEQALWLESERMGHLLGAITQPVLDAERGVVQNEKRDAESGPLAAVPARVMEHLFPEGHPYRRPVLGSMADLNAASLDDVRAWFREHYGATNAVVVLSGDIDTKSARSLMEKYFSDVPAGEPLARTKVWLPQRSPNVRETMQARVPQRFIQRDWVVPGPDARDYTLLGVAANILAGTLETRMRGELVERRKLANAVSLSVQSNEIASVFEIVAGLKDGADAAELERGLDAELARMMNDGPTAKELASIKDGLEALQASGLQRVSDKAGYLASSEIFTGDPAFNNRAIRWVQEARSQDIAQVVRRWLSDGYYQLTIEPFGEHQVAAPSDRIPMPQLGKDLVLTLPPIEEATLSNGMHLILARRADLPSLTMAMVFANAGTDTDQVSKPRTSTTLFNLMGKGPSGLTEIRFQEELQRLHASIGMSADLRNASSSLKVLKKSLPEALRLWARTLQDPAFRTEDMERWRRNTLSGFEGEDDDPDSLSPRVLKKALYPEGHPYAPRPDRAELVKALQLADLRDFHTAWVRPDNAKLFVIGDTTLSELVRALEDAFVGWRAPAEPLRALPAIPLAPVPVRSRFILLDFPQVEQTLIRAGRFVMSAGPGDALKFSAVNDMLGGITTARLGQRLRVEKGWAYGVGSSADGRLGQQYWGFSTSVQGDKTVESIVELLDVINDFVGAHPGTAEELARFVKGNSRSIPGMFEDADALLGAIVQSDEYGRPYAWVEGAKARLDALQLDEVNRIAREYITPQSLTWVITGDVSKFEQALRNLHVGDVEVWDHQGQRVR